MLMAKKKQPAFWQDSQGNLAVWQRPNKWAWLAVGSWVFARSFEDSGLLDFLALLIFYPAAGYWAYLEVTDGKSAFRRWLGVVAALLLAISLIKRIT